MAQRGPSSRGGQSQRGGSHSNQNTSSTSSDPNSRPRKESILDLQKYSDQSVLVKFSGGREIRGTLRGWDGLMNLVLDDVVEVLRDDEGTTQHRTLGLLVARGTLLTSIAPVDGSEEIANPFLAGEGEEAANGESGESGGVVMEGP